MAGPRPLSRTLPHTPRSARAAAITRPVAGGPLHVTLDARGHQTLAALTAGKRPTSGHQSPAQAANHGVTTGATTHRPGTGPRGLQLSPADKPPHAPARISLNPLQNTLGRKIHEGHTQILFRRQGFTFHMEAHDPNVPLYKKDLLAELNIIQPDNRDHRVYEFYAHEAGARYLCAQTAEIRTLAAKGRVLLPPGSEIIIGNDTLILPDFEPSLNDHLREAIEDGHSEIRFGNGPFYAVSLPFSGKARELFLLSWDSEAENGNYRLTILDETAGHIVLVKRKNADKFMPVKTGTTEIQLSPGDQVRFDSQGDILTLPRFNNSEPASIEQSPKRPEAPLDIFNLFGDDD